MTTTAGTIQTKITADPSGMRTGFAQAKREAQQFERALTGAMNKTSAAVTNLATHFAVVGKTGPEQLKQVATAGISLAGVFGPAGALVSGVGLVGITIVNWMQKARDEARETEEAYRKLASTFSLTARVAAVADFDTSEQGKKLAQWTRDLEDFQARLDRLRQNQAGVQPAGLLGDIDALRQKIAPLAAERQRLVDLVEDEARAAFGLLEAERQVETVTRARAEQQRRLVQFRRQEDEMVREGIANLRNQRAEELARIRAEQQAAVEELNRMTGVTGALAPKVDAAALREVTHDMDRFAEALKRKQAEAEAMRRILVQGALDFSDVFARALTGSIRNFRDFASQVLGIWQEMLTRMFAVQIFNRVFGPLMGSLVPGAGGGPSFGVDSVGGGPVASIAPAGGDTFQVAVHFNVSALDGVSASRVLEANKGKIAELVIDAIQTSRQVHRELRGGAF